MHIRKAQPSDIETLLNIIDYARCVMLHSNNPNQWIDGYPSREVIENDVAAENSYVCVDNSGDIMATFCFRKEVEATYLVIEGGKWLNDMPYGTIHRLAGSGKMKGVGRYCLEWCFSQCYNIRVDTHYDNRIMRSLLEKCGYAECGIIHLANGSPRLAFQKYQNR